MYNSSKLPLTYMRAWTVQKQARGTDSHSAIRRQTASYE